MIKGMDISSYWEMKDKGYRYYDAKGKETDVLDLATACGFNYARLRLWNEPENIPESGGYCGIDHTVRLAKELKLRRIPYLLDFHYSDWWADPEHQNIPRAWQDCSAAEMTLRLYAFTENTLLRLKEENVYPDMIQIGNEIRNGMLFPVGQVPNWENLAGFVHAGLKAAGKVSQGASTQLMLHLDEGANHTYYKEWFDHMLTMGVNDFDLIGLSYYPYIHGSYEAFEENLHQLAERYDKPLVIAEFAHPFRRSKGNFFREEQERAAGYPASQQGQYESLKRLVKIIDGVPDNQCKGFFYWEPFMRVEPNEENGWGTFMGVMTDEGKPTLALSSML
jgi:arabinogalactan endo-1,4-beta-galactosidase